MSILGEDPPLLSQDPLSLQTTFEEEYGYLRGCTSLVQKRNRGAISPGRGQQRRGAPPHVLNAPAVDAGAETPHRKVRGGVKGARRGSVGGRGSSGRRAIAMPPPVVALAGWVRSIILPDR